MPGRIQFALKFIPNVSYVKPLIIRDITINARKFDRSIHRSWQADLISTKEDLLIFSGKFENEIEHRDLGVIRPGTVSMEYYWLNRWYSIFRFLEPEGELRNFYCNVNLPPSFDGSVLDYVDLDIDIVVWSDMHFKVLDEEEHRINREKFGYPENVTVGAEKGLRELKRMIETGLFPFHSQTREF